MHEDATASEAVDETGDAPRASLEAGPDPVHGMALGVAGLVIMATGGAANWHYFFNVGEALLLGGAAAFIGAVTLCTAKKLDLRALLHDLIELMRRVVAVIKQARAVARLRMGL
ncbi:MAG: hypothetical protein EXR75_13575 [Myxococcales bacterium]|nr:hypothetical protein [Myxococcales bacterium]